MAQESCNQHKDEPEILKPSSSSASSSSSPPPPPSPQTAAAAPPSMFPKPSSQNHPVQRSEIPQMSDVTNSHTQNPIKVVGSEKKPSPPGVASCCSNRKPDEMQQNPSPSFGSINRCSSCRKRVGLTGFRCRCGDLFCSHHRHFNTHNCSFDYKAAGREEIALANPAIRAAKIIKI